MKYKINYSFILLPVIFTIVVYFSYLAVQKICNLPSLSSLSLLSILSLLGGTTFMLFCIIEFVFKKNKDVVGMSFLFTSTIQTILVTIIGNKCVLSQNNPFEKWNYFTFFVIYLLFETFVIGRRLNQTKF